MPRLTWTESETYPGEDAIQTSRHKPEIISFAGIDFRGGTVESLFPESGRLKLVFPVNAELILIAEKNPLFRQILSRNYSTFDGFWPYFIARLRGRKPIQRISGSEFSHAVFADAARRNLKVFFLGAVPEVNRTASQKVARKYGIQIEGYAPAFEPYPYRPETNQRIFDQIRQARPQVLMIAFGAPKQEFWLDEHRHELEAAGVELAMAVGGTFDMLAGVFQKAPAFLRSIGLEGVWRVAMDPKRIRRFPNPIRFFRIALFR